MLHAMNYAKPDTKPNANLLANAKPNANLLHAMNMQNQMLNQMQTC